MIRGSGDETSLTYSQTLNGYDAIRFLIERRLIGMEVLSGPFLVSRTGDAG
jgi:hypothetical protein